MTADKSGRVDGRLREYLLVSELKDFLKDVPNSWRVNIDINSENGWETLSVVWWGDEPKQEPSAAERQKSTTVHFPSSHCQRCRAVEIWGSWGYCDSCTKERDVERAVDDEALRIGREILAKRA